MKPSAYFHDISKNISSASGSRSTFSSRNWTDLSKHKLGAKRVVVETKSLTNVRHFTNNSILDKSYEATSNSEINRINPSISCNTTVLTSRTENIQLSCHKSCWISQAIPEEGERLRMSLEERTENHENFCMRGVRVRGNREGGQATRGSFLLELGQGLYNRIFPLSISHS